MVMLITDFYILFKFIQFIHRFQNANTDIPRAIRKIAQNLASTGWQE